MERNIYKYVIYKQRERDRELSEEVHFLPAFLAD